jgi:hypothetical protein
VTGITAAGGLTATGPHQDEPPRILFAATEAKAMTLETYYRDLLRLGIKSVTVHLAYDANSDVIADVKPCGSSNDYDRTASIVGDFTRLSPAKAPLVHPSGRLNQGGTT